MPFTITVLVLAVLASYLRGGRLSRLAASPLRWSWLLFVGLGLQAGVDLVAAAGLLADTQLAGTVSLLVSQALVAVWIVRNRYLPGMLLIATGLAMNVAVVAANGAMPVDPAAIDALGLEGARVPIGRHTLLTDATHLTWLADIWALPWLRSIISPGDVVLAIGLLPLTHALLTYRPTDQRRRSLLARQRERDAVVGDTRPPAERPPTP